MGAHTKPDLSEYASKLIKFKARQIVGHYGFIRSDNLDLEQDLAVHLIEQMDRYDPKRGGQKTFVDRIVNHRLISILRQRIAQRRDYRRCVSLDDANGDPVDGCFEAGDRRRPAVEPSTDLAIDLADVLKSLDSDAKRMCGLLMHESVAETARRLGLTRARVRTRMKEIQEVLADAGLEVYVNYEAANTVSDGVCNK